MNIVITFKSDAFLKYIGELNVEGAVTADVPNPNTLEMMNSIRTRFIFNWIGIFQPSTIMRDELIVDDDPDVRVLAEIEKEFLNIVSKVDEIIMILPMNRHGGVMVLYTTEKGL